MKKHVLILGFIFLAGFISAQSWTERHNLGEQFGEVDMEYTVITKQQFDRLLSQHTSMEEYGTISFSDVLEMSKSDGRVVKGKRPKFNGKYYYLSKTIPRTVEGKLAFGILGVSFGIGLTYGNTNSGVLAIMFGNSTMLLVDSVNSYKLDSANFVNLYNQYVGYVNGE